MNKKYRKKDVNELQEYLMFRRRVVKENVNDRYL